MPADTFADTVTLVCGSLLLLIPQTRMSEPFGSAGGGTRTPDTRIMIPLL